MKELGFIIVGAVIFFVIVFWLFGHLEDYGSGSKDEEGKDR